MLFSRRFNASVQDVRYQERMGSEAIHRVEGLTTSEDDEQDLKDSLGEDGKHVYEKLISALSEGNEAVKNAASVGAVILASHAKAWSEAETAAGRKQSAEDYLETVNVISNKPAGDVLYLNKKKSVKWFRTHENSSLASSETPNALSALILSEDMKK